MVVSSSNINQQFKQTFNQLLPEPALNKLYQQLEISEHDPGDPFWNSVSSPPGIYFVLEGKVRLLDAQDNLLVSLSEGMALGQISLFPEAELQPHAARASWGLKLGYLPKANLAKYLKPQSDLEQHLYRQALNWDLLLRCSQNEPRNRQELQDFLPVLPQLQRHELPVGDSPSHLLDQHLWVLRKGEIIHSSGIKITPGKQYYLDQLPKNGAWLINQPTELYASATAFNSQVPKSRDVKLSKSQALTAKPANKSKLQKNQPKAANKNTRNQNFQSNQLYFPSPQVKISHWWQQLTKRYPFRRQHSSSDCGVACLVMIGEYWGKRFSITELRSVANVDRSGASIKGLIVAAEYLGFSPRPIKADLTALAKQKLPAIAHWRGNHYIVVYRITKKRVIVSDPRIGRRNLSRQEFVKDWTGYTLLLTPTAELKRTPEAQHNVWKYLRLLKPHWFVLSEVLLASLMIQVIGLFTPIFTQLLLDRVVVQRSTSTLIAIGSGLIIFSLFSVIMSSLRRYLLYHTANKLDLSLIVGFISHTFQLPLSYFETRYVGDITSRIDENRKIRDFITGEAITTLLDILSVFVYVGLMVYYSWKLSLFALIIIPLFVINTAIFTPFLLRISRENFTAKTRERSYLIQGLKGVGTIKAMGVERNVRWHWEDLINESVRINFSSRMIRERLQVSTAIIQTLIAQSTLIFGVWLVIQNQMTIGQLIAFNMLVSNVVTPFERLIFLWNQFQEIIVAVERLDDVVNSPPEEDLSVTSVNVLPRIEGNISFDKVTFRYNLESETNTLENLSFQVKPGQTVALVGRSGSGKTTISKLLLGLYTPTEGRILIDGQELNNISLYSLRKQVGVVDQDTFLFGGTIIENLKVAHPQATKVEVEQACNLAGAAEFINEFPLKYDTQIGEGGGLLSGGQRQRLAIARALMGKPRLLILDEATSNLDAESERIIQNNLNTILKTQTTIVIAHRLSTIRNADLILVMDRGLLVESGTHEQLMAKRGQYYYLNQQQIALSN
ncbi:MAG: ABC transporter transmembrane domain-containing protein [Waterburya sp.]